MVVITPHALSALIVSDLATDWSDTQNPNGVWTYGGNNNTLLSVNQTDWDVSNTVFGAPQRAWADAAFQASTHVPMWFQRTTDTTQLDINIGEVGMHGSEGGTNAWVGVSWTSANDGTADLSGGIWQALKVTNDGVGGNHQSRNSDWRITLNGVVLTTGNVSGIDTFTSAVPFDLLAGSGGISALTDLSISTNDVITLEFISPTSFATFNGVNFTVSIETSTSTIPEVSTLALFGVGILGLRMLIRRREAKFT